MGKHSAFTQITFTVAVAHCTKMAVELPAFFKSLAERFKNENDLSDVTYALCQSDKAFLQFFLDFFFGAGTIDINKQKVEISREEFLDDGSRPDFTIYVDREKYLVEVKIKDRNHHFAQYQANLKGEKRGRLGYIANYTIKPKDDLSKSDQKAYDMACDYGRTVKTWKELVGRLENYQAFNDPVIRGYLQYVRNVCSSDGVFDDFDLAVTTPIKASDFLDIGRFMSSLAQKIEGMETQGIKRIPVSRGTDFMSQYYMGLSFEIQEYVDNEPVYGWAGLNYDQCGAVFFVDFENKPDWGKPVCDQFKQLLGDDQSELSFYLKDRSLAPEVFFEKIISFVKAKGKQPLPYYACLSMNDAARFESLRAMRSLPWLFESYFLALAEKRLEEVNGEGKKWCFDFYEEGDHEQPDSSCGKCYTLRHGFQHTWKDILTIWVGVNYSGSRDATTRRPFSAQMRQKSSSYRNLLSDFPDLVHVDVEREYFLIVSRAGYHPAPRRNGY